MLGGVSAGLANRWGVPVGRVRLGFAAASLLFGLGVMVYVAAWLIFPAESVDGVTKGQRGIVLLAQLCGALIGLATLAGAGAGATLFGFGWVVVALAGAILVGTLAGWSKLGPSWALLPIGALVLPSAAFAIGGVQVDPSTSSATYAPRTSAEIQRGGYTSGLGLLTLDLRKTELPKSGTINVKVKAGVRRTLVALPHDQCVHVKVTQREPPLTLRVGAALLGEGNLSSPTPIVFGQFGAVTDEEAARRNDVDFTSARDSSLPGPTLEIDYSTMGGELVVRDYPDTIDPRNQPDWPGYMVYPEERPDTTGISSEEAERMIDEWTIRRAEQVADRARIERDIAGPCAKPEPKTTPKKKRKRTR